MVEQRINSEVQIKAQNETHENPLGVIPSNGKQGTTRGKEKILMTSVGIEATTSGIDPPLLCRLSYEVGHFLFTAIHHLNRPRLSLSDLVAQSAEQR